MILKLESERFTPAGGIDGRAARRAIGKPDLEFWDLFLRETLQNSWDALANGESRIRYSVSVRDMSKSETEAMRRNVLAERPESLQTFFEMLETSTPQIIVVSDTNTRGLGGVTRADLAPEEGEPRDYVDFVRNIGRASEKALGGGTYGFGKSVLYDASNVGTIIAYSQIRRGAGIENRLIGLTVAEQYVKNGARFTGRHWLGSGTEADFVDPLTGSEARALAESLGIAAMGPDSTGTSIAILDPAIGEEHSPDEIARKLAAAASRWAWPHMVDLGSGPSIEFHFDFNGVNVPVVDPSTDPVLQHFARAYEQATEALAAGTVSDQWPWTNKQIVMMRPKRRALGVLSYRRYTPAQSTADTQLRSHVALMRGPRFVVKYLAVQEDPSGQATAGVFVATTGANDDFAKSEPVAHDDWIASTVEGAGGSAVRVALRNVKEEFRQATLGVASAISEQSTAGVAAVSRVLGSVLSGASGAGVEVQNSRISVKKAGPPPRNASVTLESRPSLEMCDGEVVAEFAFRFNAESGVDAVEYELEAAAKVVLDGGAVEDDDQRPVGAPGPRILGWFADGVLISERSFLSASELSLGAATIRIAQPDGVAVTPVINVRRTR
jgi:hypothetical protein